MDLQVVSGCSDNETRSFDGSQLRAESTSMANLPLGPSRCFPFWQELLACYVVNTDTGDLEGGRKCLPAMEDYYECLHHRKEVGQPYFHMPGSS